MEELKCSQMTRLSQECQKGTYKRIILWSAIVGLGLIGLIMAMLATRGQALLDQTYCRPTDTFYDFTASILNARFKDQYGGMYPPLIQIFFRALACMIPDYFEGMRPIDLINTPVGALFVFFFLAGCALVVAWVIADMLQSGKGLQRIVILLLFLSSPFIYGWQRANVLFIVLPLIMLFALYFDSEKWYMQLLAMIALAVAAGIKLYPAVLGLMLVVEKRWKQVIPCMILGLVAIIIPAFYYNGIDTLLYVAERLFLTSGSYDNRGLGHQLGFVNFTEILNTWFNWNLNGEVLFIIMVVIMMIAFFLTKKRWQRFAILCTAMITWPSLSFQYTMVFMTLPLIMFFNTSEDFSFWDVIYAVLFASLFIVIPLGGQNAFAFTEGQYYTLNWSTMIENFGINLLILVIFVQTIYEFIRFRISVRKV